MCGQIAPGVAIQCEGRVALIAMNGGIDGGRISSAVELQLAVQVRPLLEGILAMGAVV